jgi:adenosylcobinamide-phosphate synthase
MDWHLYILLVAIIIDALIGDPDWIWRKVPHPVVFFGYGINFADKHLNRAHWSASIRKRNGVTAIVVLLLTSIIVGKIIIWLISGFGLWGSLIEAVLVSVFIAQKSLSDHIKRVITPLSKGDIDGGRYAVSMIVGRDPKQLDQSGICRASIESLSENFSDGVVAPIFWYAIFGLPGILAYKMLNTADSMIGHMNEKYQDFGWASAKLDDLANWAPARLSALLIALVNFMSSKKSGVQSAIIALTDAGMHRSPNAGWPEAAMAGGLSIALAGPRKYQGYFVNDSYMNPSGRIHLNHQDLTQALAIFWRSCIILLVFVVFLLAG